MVSNKPEWVSQAEKQLFQRLKFHTQGEYTGAKCPVCGTGTDRLVVFEHGNYWCRRCGNKGWWKTDVNQRKPTYQKRKPPPKHLSWVPYHEHPDCLTQWGNRGVTSQEVKQWGLGYTDDCPVLPGRKSLTIPVFKQNRLLDIRYRILGDQITGKYRSESNPSLFNTDSVTQDQTILVVEGEIKTIISSRATKAVVGLPGVKYPIDELAQLYHPSQTIVLAFDPGTREDEKLVLGSLIASGIDARVAHFFDKPDDVLLEYGTDIFLEIIRQAEGD